MAIKELEIRESVDQAIREFTYELGRRMQAQGARRGDNPFRDHPDSRLRDRWLAGWDKQVEHPHLPIQRAGGGWRPGLNAG